MNTPNPSSAGSFAVDQFLVLGRYAFTFLFRWSLVWLLIALLAPDWLLPGAPAVTTSAQVLPAAIVSVFVFILGSLFVVTQLGTTIHSNRASLLLLYDVQAQRAVLRALLIAIAALVLAVVTPGSDPAPAVSALALTLAAATASSLTSATALLPTLISRITAPRSFVLYVTAPVESLLTRGFTEAVVWRVGLIGEMLKRGVQTGDFLQVQSALGGIEQLTTAYWAASAANPQARTHCYKQGTSIGWLGGELVPPLVAAGQVALADGSDEEANLIAGSLVGLAIGAAEAGLREEFDGAVEGLAQLTTSTRQFRLPASVNVAEGVYGLAQVVPAAQAHLGTTAAANVLALWTLSVAYAMRVLGGEAVVERHAVWNASLQQLASASFAEAHAVIDEERFQRRWTNAISAMHPILDTSTTPPTATSPGAVDLLHFFLALAEAEKP